MARKYRESTYMEPVGRGFWGWVRLLFLTALIVIVLAVVLGNV